MASNGAVTIAGVSIRATIWHRELVVTLVIVVVLVTHHDLSFGRLHGQLGWLIKHGGADGLRHLAYQVSHIGIHLHLYLLLLIHFQLVPFGYCLFDVDAPHAVIGVLLNITRAPLKLVQSALISFSLQLVILLYLSLVLHVDEMLAIVLSCHGVLLSLLLLATYRLSELRYNIRTSLVLRLRSVL